MELLFSFQASERMEGNGVLRQAIPFLDDEAGMGEMSSERHFGLESVLFRIASTRALVLRRGDIEAVAQGELDAAGVVVFHLSEHHAVAVECEAVDAAIEEVVAREFHVETTPKEVLAHAERQHGVGAVEPGV